MQFFKSHAGTIQSGATIAGGVTQVGVAAGGVVVADMRVNAARLMAEQKLIQFDMSQINLTLEALQEGLAALEQMVANITKGMDNALVSRHAVAKAFAANLRAV